MNRQTEHVLQWLIKNEAALKMARFYSKDPVELGEWMRRLYLAFDELRHGASPFEIIDFDALGRQIDFD